MKSNKYAFILVEAVLAFIVLAVLGLMLRERYLDEPQKVAVILPNADDAACASLKYGMRMAAQDNHLTLTFVSAAGGASAEEQRELIEEEMEDGAKAVVVRPAGGDSAGEWEELSKEIPLIFIDDVPGELAAEDSIPIVQADPARIGLALSGELEEDYGTMLDGKTIGIAYSLQDCASCKQILESFEENISGTGADILWSMDLSGQTQSMEAALNEAKAVNIVVCLDDRSLRTAASLSESNDLHGSMVYGVGSSMEAFYAVDVGSVKCVIMPDGFETGYFAVEQIASKLHRVLYRMEGYEIPCSVLRRDNLFSEENQSILYTMTQ